MLWFLAAGVGAFYAFWKTTAPTESEYREALAKAQADQEAQEEPSGDEPSDTLRGDEEPSEEQEVPLLEHANSESLGEKQYNPDDNPFKSASKEPVNGDRPRGSLDDIVDEDAPLEDYLDAGNSEEDYDASGI